MKKTITIITILVLSAIIATVSGNISDAIQKQFYPLEYKTEVEFIFSVKDKTYCITRSPKQFQKKFLSNEFDNGLMKPVQEELAKFTAEGVDKQAQMREMAKEEIAEIEPTLPDWEEKIKLLLHLRDNIWS